MLNRSSLKSDKKILSPLAAPLAVASLLCFSSMAQAEERVEIAGIVSSISGTWHADASGRVIKLRSGAAVPSGSKLKKGTPPGELTIILLDGREIKCPNQRRICGCPILLKESNNNSSINFLHGAMTLFTDTPERWISATSRSLTSVRDGVVLNDGEKTNLYDLVDTPGAEHMIYQICDSSDKILRSGTIEPQEKSYFVNGQDLKPGLYKFFYSDNSSNLGQNFAFIAMLGSKEFDRVSKSFSAAARKLKSNDDSPNRVKTAILRAYLSDLTKDLY